MDDSPKDLEDTNKEKDEFSLTEPAATEEVNQGEPKDPQQMDMMDQDAPPENTSPEVSYVFRSLETL